MSLGTPLVRNLCFDLGRDAAAQEAAALGTAQFVVLDSDGNCFTVPNDVLDSTGIAYAALSAALDTDGNSFTLPAFPVLNSSGTRFDVPISVLDSDGNAFTVIRQIGASDGVWYQSGCSGSP